MHFGEYCYLFYRNITASLKNTVEAELLQEDIFFLIHFSNEKVGNQKN